MRTIHLRSVAIGALALAFAGGIAAQTRPSSVLNAAEVQLLIKRAEPADHARLSAHFAALADQYTAEARRHTTMSKAFGGNPNRQLATGLSTHCTRLAELNSQSAATLRELAAHHKGLAVGAPSTAPRESSRFESGAGAPAPTEQELSALAARARTPAEHRSLEEYFLTLAKRYTADANEHVAMAPAYKGTKTASAAVHCERLATLSRDAPKRRTPPPPCTRNYSESIPPAERRQ